MFVALVAIRAMFVFNTTVWKSQTESLQNLIQF